MSIQLTIIAETPAEFLRNLHAILSGQATVEITGTPPVFVPETVKTEDPKPAAPKGSKAKPADPKEDPKPEPPKEDPKPEPTFTQVQVREKLSELSSKHGAEKVKALLGQFGVAKLSEIQVDKYADLMKAAEELK